MQICTPHFQLNLFSLFLIPFFWGVGGWGWQTTGYLQGCANIQVYKKQKILVISLLCWLSLIFTLLSDAAGKSCLFTIIEVLLLQKDSEAFTPVFYTDSTFVTETLFSVKSQDFEARIPQMSKSLLSSSLVKG